MKPHYILFFFWLVTSVIVPHAAADNITVEILQNIDEDFFISYNDEIFECVNDKCTFDVSSYDGNISEYVISQADAKKIAQLIAIEIDVPTAVKCDGVNESFLEDIHGNTRETITDGVWARVEKTLMPSVEQIDELEGKLKDAEVKIAQLQSESANYNEMVKSHDDSIAAKNREINILSWLCGLLTIAFIAVVGANSNAFKRIMELKWRKR